MPSWKKVVLIDKDATLNELTLNQVNNTTGDFITITNQGVISKRTPTQTLQDIGAQASLTNPVTGTGTNNFLPKFTSTGSTLGNSLVFDNGTNVGIGTTTPSERLEVISDILVNGVRIGRGGSNISTNTRVGLSALLNNTTGNLNTANGFEVLRNNTTGGSNTANGFSALRNNTTGNFNTANGRNALLNNTTGINNTANGFQALRNNTIGSSNTANGREALRNNTIGSSNTANGLSALHNNTTGNQNTANGFQAGRFIANGSTVNTITNNSVFIGSNTRALANNQSNQIVIGHDAIGIGSNTVVLGNASIVTTALKGNVGIGTTVPSEKLEVTGNIRITNSLLSNQENLDVDTGALRLIAQIPSTNHDAAFFDFVIKKGTNLRSGTVYACHDGTNVEFTETSTADLGTTEEVILSVDISSGNFRLLATTTTNDWTIKTLIRGL